MQRVTVFDMEYPAEKQAEGLAISEAVANRECEKCGFLEQCSSDRNFKPPVFAWCQNRKRQILKDWLRRRK